MEGSTFYFEDKTPPFGLLNTPGGPGKTISLFFEIKLSLPLTMDDNNSILKT